MSTLLSQVKNVHKNLRQGIDGLLKHNNAETNFLNRIDNEADWLWPALRGIEKIEDELSNPPKLWLKWVYVPALTIIPGLRILLLASIGNWGIALVRKDGRKK